MSKAFLKFIIQNLDEKVPIHPTIDPACIHKPISKHVTPHHYRSTFTHHYTLYQPTNSALLLTFSKPISSHMT